MTRPCETCWSSSRRRTTSARVLAENPTDGTVVGHQSPPEGVSRPRVGRPGLVEALSESKVGLRPSTFSGKSLFGWASSEAHGDGSQRLVSLKPGDISVSATTKKG